MLRISMINEQESIRLKLEGKLAYEWVPELQKAWAFASSHAAVGSQVVDLTDVSFVAESGPHSLTKMYAGGVSFEVSGPVIAVLIEETEGEPKPGKWLRKVILALFCLAV